MASRWRYLAKSVKRRLHHTTYWCTVYNSIQLHSPSSKKQTTLDRLKNAKTNCACYECSHVRQRIKHVFRFQCTFAHFPLFNIYIVVKIAPYSNSIRGCSIVPKLCDNWDCYDISNRINLCIWLFLVIILFYRKLTISRNKCKTCIEVSIKGTINIYICASVQPVLAWKMDVKRKW